METTSLAKWLNQYLENPKLNPPAAGPLGLKISPALWKRNWRYYKTLLRSYLKGDEGRCLRLASAFSSEGPSPEVIYATPLVPKAILKQLQIFDYSKLNKKKTALAKKAIILARPMHGGVGSSIKRESYLKEQLGPRWSGHLGSKSTDFFLPQKIQGKKTSLAEVQIQKYLLALKKRQFSHVIFEDLVGPETQKALEALWHSSVKQKKGPSEKTTPYYLGQFLQMPWPVLTEEKGFWNEHQAPAGHGLFAFDALLEALENPYIPSKSVAVISNGEDLNAGADPAIVHFLLEKKCPLAMITTTKTKTDVKGGLLGLQALSNASQKTLWGLSLFEKAQADLAKQNELFSELGLREKEGEAYFNTNTVYINYDALVPAMKKLSQSFSREDIEQMLAPDLIKNQKSKKTSLGQHQSFTQLEGAMGSVILNFNRHYQKHFGQNLLSIINIPPKLRTSFFCPIKKAFDLWELFHSDRFHFDTTTLSLKDKNKLKRPKISLEHENFQDLNYLLKQFKDLSILHLDSLKIKGEVSFNNCKLIGDVEIENGLKAPWHFEHCTLQGKYIR